LILNKKQFQTPSFALRNLIFLLILQFFLLSFHSKAQESYKLNELEIDKYTSLEDKENFEFPTNPFEIVDRIRRANSLNGATKPSDAIDDAIKSFDMINKEN
tara:strand:- start:432 stop:737 length:306 start_codon:yes stop_codon:yes gene_type:complete